MPKTELASCPLPTCTYLSTFFYISFKYFVGFWLGFTTHYGDHYFTLTFYKKIFEMKRLYFRLFQPNCEEGPAQPLLVKIMPHPGSPTGGGTAITQHDDPPLGSPLPLPIYHGKLSDPTMPRVIMQHRRMYVPRTGFRR